MILPVLISCLAVPLAAETVEEVLARMDRIAPEFNGVKADVRKESYTAVIDDTEVEEGTMWMLRQGRRAKDLRIRIEFVEPDPRSVAFSGTKGEIFYPKIETVHEYDLGKHKDLVEAFLALGFGTSGSDLAKDYKIGYLGEEEMDGQMVDHLEMVPKASSAREKLTKVELWISREGAYPLRQKFYTPSGDTTTISYSNVEINPGLTEEKLTLDLPPGVKREYPQR